MPQMRQPARPVGAHVRAGRATAALETAIWKLYEDFEEELENQKILDPMSEVFKTTPAPVANMGGPPQVIAPGTSVTMDLKTSIVESARRSSIFKQQTRWVVVASGPNGEPIIRQETLVQQWEHSEAQQQPQT